MNLVRWIKLGRAMERYNAEDQRRSHYDEPTFPTLTVRAFIEQVYVMAKVKR